MTKPESTLQLGVFALVLISPSIASLFIPWFREPLTVATVPFLFAWYAIIMYLLLSIVSACRKS